MSYEVTRYRTDHGVVFYSIASGITGETAYTSLRALRHYFRHGSLHEELIETVRTEGPLPALYDASEARFYSDTEHARAEKKARGRA